MMLSSPSSLSPSSFLEPPIPSSGVSRLLLVRRFWNQTFTWNTGHVIIRYYVSALKSSYLNHHGCEGARHDRTYIMA